MIFNELSGGIPSVSMAIITGKKTPNVMVNTGGGYPWAWRRANKLTRDRYKVTVLSSFTGGYPTYFEYIRKNDLMPFYVSCCDKAKERHLQKFFNLFPAPVTVNVGFLKGEEARAHRLVKNHSTKRISFNFPVGNYTRIECEDIAIENGFIPDRPGDPPGKRFFKTGCWFCPKQPNPPAWVKGKMIKMINKNPR